MIINEFLTSTMTTVLKRGSRLNVIAWGGIKKKKIDGGRHRKGEIVVRKEVVDGFCLVCIVLSPLPISPERDHLAQHPQGTVEHFSPLFNYNLFR